MERVVITGGAGFIGSNFVRTLLACTNARVIVVDKLTYAGNRESLPDIGTNPRFSFINADICDATAMQSVFSDHTPDTIVNFAAESHVDRSIDDARPFIDSNVVGVYVLLETARKHYNSLDAGQKKPFKLLHVSTDEVYGALGESGAFAEQSVYAPSSPYAASKASADHFVRAWYQTYGLPTLITNCSNNYGPYQYPEKLMPLMILNALEGKPLPIYGDGSNVRDWLYVEDHCDGILTVLEHAEPGARYNIGGNNERTNNEIVELLCEELERQAPATENMLLNNKSVCSYLSLKSFVDDRPGHDQRYAIDASNIRRELGWQPKTTLKIGISKTVSWYLSNKDWCALVQKGGDARNRAGLQTPGGV